MWRDVQAVLAHFSRLFQRANPKTADSPHAQGGAGGRSTTMLTLLAEERDRALLAGLAQRNRWKIIEAEGVEHAARAAAGLNPQIILLDRDVAGREWRKLITELAETSEACIVLVSKVLDENLWNEVVCNGGYEVLPKPLKEEQVLRTVRMALSYWTTANKWASARQ